jgi:AcrR family transcriptional regulator
MATTNLKNTTQATLNKAARTRAQIVEAAKIIIGSQGFTAATTDAIAKQAGVSKGVVFYHFKNKSEIASTILNDALEEIWTTFSGIVDSADTPAEKLRQMGKSFAHLIFSNRETFRFVLAELWRKDRDWSEQMRQKENRLIGMLVHEIEAGQTQGLIRPTANAQFAAVSIIGTTLTTAQFYLLNDKSTETEFADCLTDFLAHALTGTAAAAN